MENEMSTNIADLKDLNAANMQELSSNIQQEIDDGKANEYLSSDRLNNLQQLEMQQLQQLQQMQQMQQLQQMQQTQVQQMDPSDNNNDIEQKETTESSESFSTSITDMLKDPVMILVLYVAISHPTAQSLLGKWIPNLCPGEDDEIGLTNLLVQGALLVTIYFALKLFVLKS